MSSGARAGFSGQSASRTVPRVTEKYEPGGVKLLAGSGGATDRSIFALVAVAEMSDLGSGGDGSAFFKGGGMIDRTAEP